MKDIDFPSVAMLVGLTVVLCFAIRGCTEFKLKEMDHNTELKLLRMAVEQYAKKAGG